MKVGVLALQGAFREHREVLDALGVDAVEVRAPEALSALDAVVLPGGESTTMSRLLPVNEPLASKVIASWMRPAVPTSGPATVTKPVFWLHPLSASRPPSVTKPRSPP